MPSTATIEATPIAIPSADRAARARRVRRPSAPVRRTSAAVINAASPSRSSTRRGNAAAIAWSWVIVTIVEPAACSSCSSARMPAPERLSRLPVGSSANRIAGPADQRARDRHALALAARELRRRVRRAGARARPPPAPRAPARRRSPRRDVRVEQAGRDVVQRGHPVEQEELLEHEPDLARPQRRQRALAQRRGVAARRPRPSPPLGRSSVPITCSSVDLPEPDGPTTATASPAPHAQRDAAQRLDAAGIGLATRRAAASTALIAPSPPVRPSRRPSPLDLDHVVGVQPGLDRHASGRRRARPRTRRPGGRAAP